MEQTIIKALSDLKQILSSLRKKGDPTHARNEEKYLKTNFKCYGVYGTELHLSLNEFCKSHKDISKADLLYLLDSLWTSKYHTEKTFAIKLVSKYISLFGPKDIPYFKKWLKESDGWCHTDYICGLVVGELVYKHPTIKKTINCWRDDKVLWVRRASLISYIVSIRHTDRDIKDVFNNSIYLSGEKDFFIRKAIGWILREASKKYPKEVLGFVSKYENKLSNLSKKEAIRNIKLKKTL